MSWTPGKILGAAFALGCIGLAGCRSHGEEATGSDPALAGLTGVEVRVFPIHDAAIRALVPEESLQVDFKRRLRGEGIRVLTHEECVDAPGAPQLWVLFQATEAGSNGGYAIGVDLCLMQSVQLSRDPLRTVRAITWNSRYRIRAVPDLNLERARRSFDSAWTEFRTAFRAEEAT